MTFREIDILLKRGQIRRHNNYALRARLHGHEVPFKSRPKKEDEITWSKEQTELADKAADAALRKLKAKHEKRKRAMGGGSNHQNLRKF